mgnify:CR=1 FL=1
MTLLISNYANLVFDCDGVLLNSNAVKTGAFYRVAAEIDEESAQALVAHHVANGGISRNQKFLWLAERLQISENRERWVALRCAEFAEQVVAGLMRCEARDLVSLRARYPDGCWFVVSGGAQDELRQVFEQRDLARFFDGGIFGSPQAKDQILSLLRQRGALKGKSLFLGDSRYDCEVALRHELDFVFVHGWSDVSDWQTLCEAFHVPAIGSIEELAD